MTNIDEDQDESRLQTAFQRVDTFAELNDETMQFMEIDEGHKQLPTLKAYYVIPEIKSLDFLNLKQSQYQKYFQSTYSSEKKPMKKQEISPTK